MKVIPFKDATFTVADAVKANALRDCVELMYLWCADYRAHYELYGEAHPILRRVWGGDIDAMVASTHGLEDEIASMHAGTMYSHYDSETKQFNCWWEVHQ